MTRWLLVLGLGFLPAVAWACPVCFDPRETSRAAFLGTTAFLSLLPLAMMGGIFAFVRWKVKVARRTARLATVHEL